MIFYNKLDYPLRVYLKEEIKGEINKLILHVDSKYDTHEDTYLTSNHRNEEEERHSLFFYDENSNEVYIPSGLLPIIKNEVLLAGFLWKDEVSHEESPILPDIQVNKDILSGIELRDYQVEGIVSSLKYKRGIIQVHTGGGKTEMMIGVCSYLLANTSMNILICVPTTNLLYQTHERMLNRGVSESDISLLGDGHDLDPSKRVLVSTVQSAYRKFFIGEVHQDWISHLGCLMLDEAHHSKCATWSALIDKLSPEYLLGFSAEPFHRDKNHMIPDLLLRGLLGPVIHRVTVDYLVEKGFLSKPYVVSLDSKCASNLYRVFDWTLVNKSGIVKNKLRNSLICDASQLLINMDKKPLILVQQIAHGVSLAEELSAKGYRVIMLKGGLRAAVFQEGKIFETYVDTEGKVVKEFNEGKIDALIGTSTLDEGVDIPSLSAVILAGGGKGRIKTLQRIGRGLRRKAGDNTTVIVDFRDRFNLVTHSHHKKRKAMFDELNIPVYYVDNLEGLKVIVDKTSKSLKCE